MARNRIDQALELIEETLEKTYDEGVKVSTLLLKCQGIARYLGLEEDYDWIKHESIGYPEVDIKDPDYGFTGRIPDYRSVRLLAHPTKVMRTDSGYAQLWAMQAVFPNIVPSEEFEVAFPITQSCGALECITENLEVSRTLMKWKSGTEYGLTMKAVMGLEHVSGILSSVRGRVHDFLISQRIELLFGPFIESIFDETKEMVAKKLSSLDPGLLAEIASMLQRQNEGKNELGWSFTIDVCRRTVQRFTEVLLVNGMVPNGEDRPSEDDTLGKTNYIVGWARTKIGRNHAKEEIAMIREGHDYFIAYFKSLKGRIEKVKHKPSSKISKDEVNRVVAHVILWMADVMQLLERAGYNWTAAPS